MIHVQSLKNHKKNIGRGRGQSLEETDGTVLNYYSKTESTD